MPGLDRQGAGVTVLVGDCRSVLRGLADESVHCVVTSPPYFGLRDYGNEAQIGLEQTPAEYVEQLVEVFREVRRVLRSDGTLWLNLGDSYEGSGRGGNVGAASTLEGSQSSQDACAQVQRGSRLPAGLHAQQVAAGALGRAWVPPPQGLKNKDLMGIPWRVAFALQEDGWYLRQDIIWSKPNPMPESIKDRCTKAHEYLFLLSKSERYYYDADAIAEPSICFGKDDRSGKGNLRYEGKRTSGDASVTGQQSFVTINEKRNRRSVWTVPTSPFKGAHFATFPPDLIRPCILAGCPGGGLVLDPFAGSGTTGLVAQREQRGAVLVELNPTYAALIRERLSSDAPLFADVEVQEGSPSSGAAGS